MLHESLLGGPVPAPASAPGLAGLPGAPPARPMADVWGPHTDALLDVLAENRSMRTAEPEFRGLLADLMLLRVAVECSPVCTSIADMRHPDQPLVFINPAFTRMTGYPWHEAVGRNARFLQSPNTDRAAVAAMGAAIAAGQPITVELVNRHRDGTDFRNRLQLQPVHDAGGRLLAYVGHQQMVDHDGRPRLPEPQLSSSESQYR